MPGFVRLRWDEKWNSGYFEIDDSHRNLVEMGNQLLHLTLSGANMEAVLNQLENVIEYIERHFDEEERVLVDIGYPDLIHHQKVHKDLIEEALKLKDSLSMGDLKASDVFSFIVDDVIMGHMLKEDALFYPYAKKAYCEC